ncbi:hypothetical protein FOS14_14540 [Skermania sp. ID1734]|uniref:nucleotidyltransferase family protein n=1 Tax=Skermania sp. ID1734 TaxID=2597516 RepID=UPI00118139C9|nr:nucleotidyltransferase domain-containing protein [Skermania sp. ID1734]TSD97210.1 hypothetical protein FOS14_14540 [Skermania sp. ID1734]
MHPLVESRLPEVAELCRRFGVRRLALFGSAVGESFDETRSDIDVLVEFETGASFDHYGNYFGLKEGLEELFGRPTDVVTLSSIKNPYFRAQAVRNSQELYAA